MISIWDKVPSEKLRKHSITNMTKLGHILAEFCYTALMVYEEKQGRSLKSYEINSVMDTELDLLITQNMDDEEWRQLVFEIARNKYSNR